MNQKIPRKFKPNFREITNPDYEQLKQLVKEEYKSDPNCVYDVYLSNSTCRYYFVVLRLLPNTQTNESCQRALSLKEVVVSRLCSIHL